jgi:hypothetical protein
MMPRILAFASSTRRESFNKKLVTIAAQGAREAGEVGREEQVGRAGGRRQAPAGLLGVAQIDRDRLVDAGNGPAGPRDPEHAPAAKRGEHRRVRPSGSRARCRGPAIISLLAGNAYESADKEFCPCRAKEENDRVELAAPRRSPIERPHFAT